MTAEAIARRTDRRLNDLGGAHGIGRVDLVENRLVGMKSRGVYETPGGTILLAAHQELESLVLDRETMHYKDLVAAKYAELVYNGLWFTPLREALDAFVDSTQERSPARCGSNCTKAISSPPAQSPFSLYREDYATFGQDTFTTRRTPRASSTSTACRSRCAALKRRPISGMDMPEPDYSRFKRD